MLLRMMKLTECLVPEAGVSPTGMQGIQCVWIPL